MNDPTCCSITYQIMRHPVLVTDVENNGHHYELQAIYNHVAHTGFTNPKTGRRIKSIAYSFDLQTIIDEQETTESHPKSEKTRYEQYNKSPLMEVLQNLLQQDLLQRQDEILDQQNQFLRQQNQSLLKQNQLLLEKQQDQVNRSLHDSHATFFREPDINNPRYLEHARFTTLVTTVIICAVYALLEALSIGNFSDKKFRERASLSTILIVLAAGVLDYIIRRFSENRHSLGGVVLNSASRLIPEQIHEQARTVLERINRRYI